MKITWNIFDNVPFSLFNLEDRLIKIKMLDQTVMSNWMDCNITFKDAQGNE